MTFFSIDPREMKLMEQLSLTSLSQIERSLFFLFPTLTLRVISLVAKPSFKNYGREAVRSCKSG